MDDDTENQMIDLVDMLRETVRRIAAERNAQARDLAALRAAIDDLVEAGQATLDELTALREQASRVLDERNHLERENGDLRQRAHTLANQAQNLELKVARLELALAQAAQADPVLAEFDATVEETMRRLVEHNRWLSEQLRKAIKGSVIGDGCDGWDGAQGDVPTSETVTQLAASYASEHPDLRAKLEAAAQKRLERDDVDGWRRAFREKWERE